MRGGISGSDLPTSMGWLMSPLHSPVSPSRSCIVCASQVRGTQYVMLHCYSANKYKYKYKHRVHKVG